MGVQRLVSRAVWAVRSHRCAALVVLAVLCACAARAPVQLSSRVHFPRVHPAALAQLLADFSTHPHSSHSWQVVEERGNYTAWSYLVRFECGARCAGEARVQAAEVGGGAPRHGTPPAAGVQHAVRAHLRACQHAPMLRWPQVCDEVSVEWLVSRDGLGAGSVVVERARAWCGVLRVLGGACARELRALRDQHMARVRLQLPAH